MQEAPTFPNDAWFWRPKKPKTNIYCYEQSQIHHDHQDSKDGYQTRRYLLSIIRSHTYSIFSQITPNFGSVTYGDRNDGVTKHKNWPLKS